MRSAQAALSAASGSVMWRHGTTRHPVSEGAGKHMPNGKRWATGRHRGALSGRLRSRIARLSLEQKIGQLLIAGFPGTGVGQEARTLVQDRHLGSVILFGRNCA